VQVLRSLQSDKRLGQQNTTDTQPRIATATYTKLPFASVNIYLNDESWLSFLPSDVQNHRLLMFDTRGNRPGEDAIARILDWVGLAFGLSIILFVTNFSFTPI
jgi:hypothetical protein